MGKSETEDPKKDAESNLNPPTKQPPDKSPPLQQPPPPPFKAAMLGMKLRVLPVIELPHILTYNGKQYIFDPDEVVPAEFGNALLKNNSSSFAIAKDKPDMKLYKFRKKFQETELSKLVLSLTDKQKTEVVRFIGKMLE